MTNEDFARLLPVDFQLFKTSNFRNFSSFKSFPPQNNLSTLLLKYPTV